MSKAAQSLQLPLPTRKYEVQFLMLIYFYSAYAIPLTLPPDNYILPVASGYNRKQNVRKVNLDLAPNGLEIVLLYLG